MKNKWFIALLVAVMCFSSSACAGGRIETSSVKESVADSESGGKDPSFPVDYSTYASFWMRGHDYKTMPVAVFNALPNMRSGYTYDYLANAESTIAAYAEAGVNTLYGLYELCTLKGVENALDVCYDRNIAYLVNMGDAANLTDASAGLHNLDRVKYHDAFAGVMASDEPGKTMFGNLGKSFAVLDRYIDGAAEGALWHANLFPAYASQKQLYNRVNDGELPEGGYTYEEYLSDFIREVNPKVLSYDFYPCRGAEGSLSGGYFENMALVRKYAAQANIPFWVYIQACSFGGNTRVPTKGDILWQVNTALCYGAKGIQYFCGVTPSDGGGESFVGCYFDRGGNKTPVYDYAKEANLQIAAADEVLMCSRFCGMIVSGSTPWGEETDSGIAAEDLLSEYGVLKSVAAAHALTGCFDYDGKNAYYLVNDSSSEKDEASVSFSSSVKGYYVQGGEKKSFSGNTLSLALTAGEGVLIVAE